MWKDFFFFSASQRIGIIILVCLILIISAMNFIIPYFYEDFSPYNDSLSNAEFEKFKNSLISLDSLNELKQKERYKNWEDNRYADQYTDRHKYQSNEYKLFEFDPNELDSAGFVSLGLKSYVASNILKYRKKGGKFLSKDAFSKVYGISKDKHAELEPYIKISPSYLTQNKDTSTNNLKDTALVITIELNSADTASLMKVKGIGKGYAKSIIRFRNQTGGFINVEQLMDVYGMTEENYNRIKAFCTVNQSLIRKINVNTTSLDKLKSHPYINFYQAKQIYELRRKLGKLTSINELKNLSELDENTLRKIEPYLIFE